MSNLEHRLQRLRERAEHMLQHSDVRTEIKDVDISGLLHELDVYHAELELQLEELRYAYAELEDVQHLYQNLFDFVPIGYVVTDKRGFILNANQTLGKMLHLETKKLKTMSFAEFVIDSERDRFHIHHRAALNSCQQQECTIQLQQSNGTIFFARLITQLRQGNLPTLQTAIMDNSVIQHTQDALKRTIAQKNETNHLRDRVLTLISHNFRTPLSIILTSAEILDRHDGQITPEKKKQHYQKIISSALYLRNVMDDASIVSELITELPPLRLKTFDLLPFMHQLRDDIMMLSPQGQCIHLKIKSKMEQEFVTWDPNLFSRIIMNLVSNGFQYSETDVTCMVDCEDSIIRFQIIDQGIGIEEGDEEHIFEAFYRGKNAEFAPGTGIGLYVVELAVKAHRGAIRFKSVKNEGSTFTVELPSHSDHM